VTRGQSEDDENASGLHLDHLEYLTREARSSRDPLLRLVRHPRVEALRAEMRARVLEEDDPMSDRWRATFDPLRDIRSPGFAAKLARDAAA
jgi:hypothetical protein